MNLCDIKQINALLARHGFRFSKSMGQNFLSAAWVPEQMAEEAGLDDTTGVLEVGPGIGCLTVELAQRAKKVVCIELDNTLLPVLNETLADCHNAQIVSGDVMRTDLKAFVSQHFSGLRTVVCANLPYNITTPVLAAFMEAGCFETVTVMVQREAAQRICAKAGTAEYGAFTVMCNWYTQPELLFDVPAECFVPSPKVCSSVVRLTMRKEPPAAISDGELFKKIVKAAFNQRRKTLANAMSSVFPSLSKAQITEMIISCGLDERIRGEVLSLEKFAQLANEVYRNI